MTDEEFIDGLIISVINENMSLYRNFLEEATAPIASDWVAIASMISEHRTHGVDLLLHVIHDAVVDSVSSILGIIDGSSQINGQFRDFQLIASNDGNVLNGVLQDIFLRRIEESKV